jgi:hypothetical protein
LHDTLAFGDTGIPSNVHCPLTQIMHFGPDSSATHDLELPPTVADADDMSAFTYCIIGISGAVTSVFVLVASSADLVLLGLSTSVAFAMGSALLCGVVLPAENLKEISPDIVPSFKVIEPDPWIPLKVFPTCSVIRIFDGSVRAPVIVLPDTLPEKLTYIK